MQQQQQTYTRVSQAPLTLGGHHSLESLFVFSFARISKCHRNHTHPYTYTYPSVLGAVTVTAGVELYDDEFGDGKPLVGCPGWKNLHCVPKVQAPRWKCLHTEEDDIVSRCRGGV